MQKEEVLSDLAFNLDMMSLFDLRQVAREVGVNRPADGKKAYVMGEVLGIAQGIIEPIKPSKRGAPPKSQIFNKEMVAQVRRCRALFLGLEDADSYYIAKMRVGDVAYEGNSKEITGILDKSGDNWFIRDKGFSVDPMEDVFVNEYYVNCFDLRIGDEISCIARTSKDQTYGLTGIITVNGSDKVQISRVKFENLTYSYPQKRISLAADADDVAGRMIDLFAPVALGQRAFFVSPVKCGKTYIIKNLINSFNKNYPDLQLIALFSACRPEEAVDLQRTIPENIEVYYSTFNADREEHLRVANFAFERAKRGIENGKNVVVFTDGLYRALSPEYVAEANKLVYYACNAEEGGTITVFATKDCEKDGDIDSSVTNVANMCVSLSRGLAITRTFPAIDILNTFSDSEERLLSGEETEVITALRREVYNGMPAEELINLFKQTKDNAEIIKKYKK